MTTRTLSKRFRMLRLIGVALVMYLAYLSLVFFMQRRILYPGWGVDFGESVVPADVERWEIDLPEGAVHAYFGLGEGVSVDAPGPAVVVTHGNGGSAPHWFATMEGYRAAGVSVLMPEYRGYDGAAGEPTQQGIVSDIEQFHDRLAARPEVDGIVFHGISLGGGVAVAVARARKPRALVLQSTFTSIRAFAASVYAPGFLVRDPYDTKGFLEGTSVPVLIFHGTQDQVIPVAHARENAAAASDARLVLVDEAHGIPATDAYWTEVFALLKRSGVR